MSEQTSPPTLSGVPALPRSTQFWWPRGCALLAAALAPLPLALDLKLGIGMARTAPFVWSLSVLLVVVTLVLARRNRDRTLLRTVLVALFAGALATSTYDTFRIVGLNARVIPVDEALDFGYRLTGQVAPGAMQDAMGDQMNDATSGENQSAAQSHPEIATLLGYLYHFWNGMMFSLAFLILFGGHRWWLLMPLMALGMPMLYMLLVIYSGMVVVMGIHSTGSFILEAVGHVAFGATLGVVSWAYLRGNAG